MRNFSKVLGTDCCPHLQGVADGLVKPKMITRLPGLCCLSVRSAWAQDGMKFLSGIFLLNFVVVKVSNLYNQWLHLYLNVNHLGP